MACVTIPRVCWPMELAKVFREYASKFAGPLMLATSQGVCLQTCWPSCLQPVRAYASKRAGPLACNPSGHIAYRFAGPLVCNWSGHNYAYKLAGPLACNHHQGICIPTCWPSCLQPSPGHLHTNLLALLLATITRAFAYRLAGPWCSFADHTTTPCTFCQL